MVELLYIADPMCSWCWGFAPVLEQVRKTLPENATVRYVMGGLAADSEAPMPEETRQYIQGAWRAVAERTGAQFNWNFWERCVPKRSTYMACRAVITAEQLQAGAASAMFHRIQQAYYCEARNPSESEMLVELAIELGLNGDQFLRDLRSPQIETLLQADFQLRREADCRGFPSLIMRIDGNFEHANSGYDNYPTVAKKLESMFSRS
jgi:putative protein-disulfide isomerase